MNAIKGRLLGACLACLLALALVPALSQASPRSSRYAPNPNARTFNGGAGGWTYSTASSGLCVPVLLCPVVSNSHRQTGSNGYLRTRLGALLGVGATSKGILVSPAFTYRGAAGKTPSQLSLSLSRRSNVGQLLAVVGNSATYEVGLQDVATSQSVAVFTPRTLAGADTWTTTSANLAASQLKKGHRYRIRIATTYNTGATILPGGSADYDNVVLLARGPKSGGGTGGGGSTTSHQLRILILHAYPAKAKLKGNRFLITLRCPKRVKSPCKIAAAVYLKRHGAKATRTKHIRIAAGHRQRVILHVKRRYVAKLRHKRRVLVKQLVIAGGVRARTIHGVRLIHR